MTRSITTTTVVKVCAAAAGVVILAAAGGPHAGGDQVDNVRSAPLDDVNLVGTYALNGTRAGGGPLEGSITFAKIGGERYRGTATIGGKSYQASGYRDGDVFSFTTAESNAIGVTVFTLYCDFSLEGVLYTGEQETPASSWLATGGNSSTAGTYTVKGENADQSTFGGTLEVALSAGVYTMSYLYGKGEKPMRGPGLRMGQLIATSMRTDDLAYTIFQVRISRAGAELTGRFAEWLQGEASGGSVTLARR